jgi:hypothetical protein
MQQFQTTILILETAFAAASSQIPKRSSLLINNVDLAAM